MIARISKFLVALVCAFCITFCGVSAGQTQKDQNFNIVIREVLVNVPDIEVPAKFQSVAFKTLSITETLKGNSNQHEFNGVRALRDIFGDEKQKFDTTFVYLSKDKPIVARANSTWYSYNTPSGGSGFRLYYRTTPVAEAMGEGDVLFIGKPKDGNKLFIIVANSKSPVKDKLLASFNTEQPATSTTKKKNADGETGEKLVSELRVEPSETWYRVFFTPGCDCENNIISRLDNSKNNIDIAVYSITNRNIVDAILAAHKRGVKVRVMTDNMQEKGTQSLVKELAGAGVPVRTNANSAHKIEHNKFAIFDGKEMESGSYNWTNSATKSNSENCMFFKQTGKEFSDRYEYLWKFYDKENMAACQ